MLVTESAMHNESLPKSIRDEAHLEQLLSAPTETAIHAMSQVAGDVLLLGAGGKMGPSLARMTRRASEQAGIARRVIAVSRFSDTKLPDALHSDGIETIRGDLLDEDFVQQLPAAPNVIFMTGAKFGTSGNASATWATNVYLPSVICRRFRSSRILAFSTGNVYPLVPIESGGSLETDLLDPVGEYGMSALGRERMFEYFSRQLEIPTAIVRLNYAVELRYGVVVDLAQQVFANEPVDLSMGFANVIWQADANAMALCALADAEVPPLIVNVAGPELLDVGEACRRFSQQFGKTCNFVGAASPTALLSNSQYACGRYGKPRVSLDRLIVWTADWLSRGGITWNKSTHFQVRDGRF
jgi:nucleoside-diphosphate-sugar epimerase